MNKKFSAKIFITNTNHIIINCKVNKVKASFILDTGASNSCINSLLSKKFKLKIEKSSEIASSASSNFKSTFYSKRNSLEIAGLKKNDFEVFLFDMTHINKTLNEEKVKNIDGIIGGDILKQYNAVINYKKEKLKLEF